MLNSPNGGRTIDSLIVLTGGGGVIPIIWAGLRHLAEAGAVESVMFVEVVEGGKVAWELKIGTRGGVVDVHTQKGKVRRWVGLNPAIGEVREAIPGLREITVKLAERE